MWWADVLANRDFICFGEDWGKHITSAQHIIKEFAKCNRVIWVNSISYRSPRLRISDLLKIVRRLKSCLVQPQEKNPNLRIVSPVVIPFPQFKLVRRFNKFILLRKITRICKQLNFKDPILWISVFTAADFVGSLGESVSIYYCSDEFSEFPRISKRLVKELEEPLMRKVDLLIVTSKELLERKKSYNPNTILVTHGVDYEHFSKAQDKSLPVAEDIRNIPHPIIGFYGTIDDWVDLDLIKAMAISHPEWSIVLIGEVLTDIKVLNGIRNIHILGPRKYTDLPSYSRAFDVALIPFKLDALTKCVNPLKLLEYLAAGLPVVSIALPELEQYGSVVNLAKNTGGFMSYVEVALETSCTTGILAGIELSSMEGWNRKVEEISDSIPCEEKLVYAA
jgi:glycosyltransferase involved in cell wall biosynthesis